jgi:hypothetical protein
MNAHPFIRRMAYAAVATTMLAAGPLVAQTETTTGTVLREGVSETYVVQRGDTLWDISARFLTDPWRWPDIWHVNPEIENPHLIYPGDIIRLVWVDGEPRLVLEREPVAPRPPPGAPPGGPAGRGGPAGPPRAPPHPPARAPPPAQGDVVHAAGSGTTGDAHPARIVTQRIHHVVESLQR